jgi:phage gp45-like
MRFSTRTVGDRMHNAVKRVTVEDTNEDPLFRESTLSLYLQEKQKEIEHMEPYGLTSRVKKPDGSSSDKKKAEGLMVFTGGNRSHGVLIVAGDRRYRLRGLKEGEVALFDDQGQQVHFTRDGIVISAPNGKKIVTQVMKDDKAPKPPSSSGAAAGSGSSDSAKYGQSAQATQEAATSLTLTKDSWVVNHPKEIKFTVGNTTLHLLPDSVEITSPTISHVATKRTETIGPTYLGLDGKGGGGPLVETIGGPAEQTYAKV